VTRSPAPATILVVEDEPTIASAVAKRLVSEGYTVEVAHDGPSGVAAAERLRPDLVILDVMLPGFDGLEVCRRIQRERRVPVLMLTARDAETDLLVGLGVGADDYVTKPFSPVRWWRGSRPSCGVSGRGTWGRCCRWTTSRSTPRGEPPWSPTGRST
jgi:CheY-like chemotaxis protein